MSKIDLSIVIINYNTFELTFNCIQSVYKNTSGITYEIIIVDNNSSECNPDLFKEKFQFLNLIKNNENIGFARGNNVGIKHARGNTILLLNSDIEIINNSIGIAFHSLHNIDESVGVVTAKLMSANGEVQPNCGRFPSIILQLTEFFRLQKLLTKRGKENLLLGGFFTYDYPVYPDWVWGTFFMFKRDVLNCFPGKKLTETFFMYNEDLEWCYFVRKKWKIYFEPKAKVIHYVGSSSIPFYGKDLNPMIDRNFKQLILKEKGVLWASVYFTLVKLNRFVSRSIWQN